MLMFSRFLKSYNAHCCHLIIEKKKRNPIIEQCFCGIRLKELQIRSSGVDMKEWEEWQCMTGAFLCLQRLSLTN